MEAMVGASVAALTVYDMVKGVSHEVVIGEVKLMEKKGGKRVVEDGKNVTGLCLGVCVCVFFFL